MITRKSRARALIRLSAARCPRHQTTLPTPWVYVAYKVRNVSGQVFGNGNPAWLAVFDSSGGPEFQEDENNSVIPSDLQPGGSAVELVSFATPAVTGQFTLRSNDQLETVLATSVLRTP